MSTADEVARKKLVEQVIADVGGALTVGLGYIGDRLGIFKALAAAGPVSSTDLASRLNLNERYVREWLKAMVAAGYVEWDSLAGRFFMTADQQAVLAQEGAPMFAAGAFQFAIPSLLMTEGLVECFRSGSGISYGELSPEIPTSIDRMHRAWFDHLLTGVWLPGVPALEDRLKQGARVLDVGCGAGRASLAIARSYPASSVVGVDPHSDSIETATELAVESGLSNVRFEVTSIESMSESDRFDIVLAIDCIHDMRDPVDALAQIRKRLAPGGQLFWSEPTGSADPMENREPPEKMRSALSPYHCLTVSLAEGGAGLGTIIGESGARELAERAGFGTFEKVPIENRMQQFFLVS